MAILQHGAAGLVGGSNLRQGAATHGKFAVVADFEQRGPKTPLVRGTANGCTAVYALWGNPWDTLNTL